MGVTTVAVLLLATLGSSKPAFAQGAEQGTRPAAPGLRSAAEKPPVGFLLFGGAEADLLAASRSFEAVTGTSTMAGFVVGGEVLNLWRHAVVRVTVSRMSKSGSRVGPPINGVTASIGVPETISIVPVEIGGGWRFETKSGATPYIGGAIVVQRFQEQSGAGVSLETTSLSNTGGGVFGGVELGLARRLVIRIEGAYRTVPNAIGAEPTAISKDFGETNLGGAAVRVLIGFRR